jgi:hypothetical protein
MSGAVLFIAIGKIDSVLKTLPAPFPPTNLKLFLFENAEAGTAPPCISNNTKQPLHSISSMENVFTNYKDRLCAGLPGPDLVGKLRAGLDLFATSCISEGHEGLLWRVLWTRQKVDNRLL